MLVPDSDPELRSLLTACHAADDPVPPLVALADWLGARHDPRGPPVRLGARCQQVITEQGWQSADFGVVQRDVQRTGGAVVATWLGLSPGRRPVSADWPEVLPRLTVHDGFDTLPDLARGVVEAGWLWELSLTGPQVDEALDFLLARPGPICYATFVDNPSLRDGDLEALTRVPHLRHVHLCGTGVTDGGLRHLHRIPTLRSVDTSCTRVTAAGRARLKEALPGCDV